MIKRILLILMTTLMLAAPMASAQGDPFTTGYEKAKASFYAGKYDDAMKQLDIIRPVALSAKQNDDLNRLYRDCQLKKAEGTKKAEVLILTSTQIGVQAQGGDYSVSFEVMNPSKKKSAVTASAATESSSWIYGVSVDEDASLITFKIHPNDISTQRIGQIIIKKGELREYLTVSQMPKPIVYKTVVFSTTPKQAIIHVNGTQLEFNNLSGEYLAGSDLIINVEKSGYDSINQIVHINDTELEQTTVSIPFTLVPRFGMVRFEIKPEEGFEFDPDTPEYKNYTLRLNSEEIKLDPDSIKSFDDYEKEMKFYKAYEDAENNVWIPVDFDGEIRYKITAPGYFDFASTVSVEKGEKKVIPVTLQARTGLLSVLDEKRADGASVFLDGKCIGNIPVVNYRVAEGEHVIRFEKEGHSPIQEIIPISIANDEYKEVYASMRRVAEYSFQTTPAYDALFIDGELQGSRVGNKFQLAEKPDNAPYSIVLVKKGYLPYSGTLTLTEEDFGPEGRTFTHEFSQLYSLEFKGDEPGLRLDVTAKDGTLLLSGIDLPSTIELPLSKAPYNVKLWRSYADPSFPQKVIWKEAYRGRMKFDSESKSKHSVITNSRTDLRILTLNMSLSAKQFPIGVDPNSFTVAPRGDVGFINFKILPGWTTSILKAGIFSSGGNPLAKRPVSVPQDIAKKEADATFDAIGILPAFSAMFLNDEFRIGGRITDYANVCLMGTYTWYPDLVKKIAKFNHFSGHEIFIGVEASTRLPIASVSFRAGWLTYGKPIANIYNENINVNDKDAPGYWAQPLDIPNMIVVSLGISLGTHSVKGNNILTLFRLL